LYFKCSCMRPCEDTRLLLLLSSMYLRPHVHSAVAAHNSLLAHTYLYTLYIRKRGDARAPMIIFFSIVFGSTSAWHFLGGRAYIYIYIYMVCVCVQVWRIIIRVYLYMYYTRVHFVRLFDKFTTVYTCTYTYVCVCVCVLYVCLSPWIIVGRVAIGNYVKKNKK